MLGPKNSSPPPPPPLALEECLAKTRKDEQGNRLNGRNVEEHSLIVAAVAQELLAREPAWLRDKFFPSGSILLTALHDIGKLSPGFQEKIRSGERETLPKNNHSAIGQATANYWKLGKYIPEIIGSHHGKREHMLPTGDAEVYGGLPWLKVREELLAKLKTEFGEELPSIEDSLHQDVLGGLTTVADWLGSGSWFEDPKEDWRPLLKETLDKAGFAPPTFQTGLSFEDIFGFKPHKTQECFIEKVAGPGVYVLEAPMGLGKTEAALYAAYKVLSRNQARGLYFALPTQLTSDKIHERVNAFLGNILTPESPQQWPQLLHSNAWLNKELGEEGNPGGAWFSSLKRGILAPFGVGTIDQALMAVMNVKHWMVRSFGLVGKVVILDEVHSYDSYTGTILDELVTCLQKLDCTVIILSATLSLEKREVFLQKGLKEKAYPLISALRGNELVEEPGGEIPKAEVAIKLCEEDEAAFAEALSRAYQGQQVLWIENTVAEAQEAYKRLAATVESEAIVECGLIHSRFLKIHRQEKENQWTAIYGKNGGSKRSESGRILVGTQVLEQSLDIDADFLVSRFAPSDILLQRIGRLWRHQGTIRPAEAKREAWLLLANTKQEKDKTAAVYSPYVLRRSLEVWQGKTLLILPQQIREIIEATYQSRSESGKMHELQSKLEERRNILRREALSGLSVNAKTGSDHNAQTRYSEQDSLDMIILKGYKSHPDGVELHFLNDEKAFFPKLKSDNKRKLAALLMQNSVRKAPENQKDQKKGNYDFLKGYIYVDEGLRVVRIDPAGQLSSLEGEKLGLEYDSRIGLRY